MIAMSHLSFRAKSGFTLVEVIIVVLIIGVLLSIALPTWIRARDTSRAKACIENLSHIEAAKNQYIMSNNMGVFVDESDLAGGPEPLYPTYLRAIPQCPGGGTYHTGDIANIPNCSLAPQGHSLT
jgi:prepilin-type N-terminal cleavage/methylation domain-containing protein